MAIINPIALATKGMIAPGGTVSYLPLATIGVLSLSGGSPPATPTANRRRRTYFTMIGRSRLGR